MTLDYSVTIALTEEAIAKGLRARTLMPSSALTLIIVQELENLTCGGGPSQMQYLSSYATQWSKLLSCFEQASGKRKPTIWCGDCNLFSITNAKKDHVESATLIDLLLYTEDKLPLIDSELAATSLSSSIDAMIPALYTINTHQKTAFQADCAIPSIMIR